MTKVRILGAPFFISKTRSWAAALSSSDVMIVVMIEEPEGVSPDDSDIVEDGNKANKNEVDDDDALDVDEVEMGKPRRWMPTNNATAKNVNNGRELLVLFKRPLMLPHFPLVLGILKEGPKSCIFRASSSCWLSVRVLVHVF
jgi:hypothetical protein